MRISLYNESDNDRDIKNQLLKLKRIILIANKFEFSCLNYHVFLEKLKDKTIVSWLEEKWDFYEEEKGILKTLKEVVYSPIRYTKALKYGLDQTKLFWCGMANGIRDENYKGRFELISEKIESFERVTSREELMQEYLDEKKAIDLLGGRGELNFINSKKMKKIKEKF